MKRSTSKAGADAGELRRQLRQAKTNIQDLEEELQEKNNMYQAAIQERDAGKARVAQAEDALGNVEALVAAKVSQVRTNMDKKLNDREAEIKKLKTRVKEQDDNIRDFKTRLEKMSSVKPGGGSGYEGSSMDQLRKEMAAKEKELQKSQKYCNYLQDQVEDFMAENKFLRTEGNVKIPDNFGINREQVKLKDKAIIDDYKKLARVLQEDNYKLETERAKLKHKIKQLVQSGSKTTPQIGKGVVDDANLTQAQKEKVAEYAFKLQANNIYEDEELDPFTLLQENRRLNSQNAELREAQERGYGFIRDELERLMTHNVPKGGAGLSPEDLQALSALQLETRAKLDELTPLILEAAAGAKQGLQSQSFQNRTQGYSASAAPLNVTGTIGTIPQPSILMEKLRPPVPRPNPDNTVSQGYSYKFDTKLPVTGRGGEEIGLGKEADPQENAFLQLQLQECFELLKRKDTALGSQKKEVDNLHARLKKYLLMQDHLYKDFVTMENKHATQTAELRDAAIRAEQGQKLAKEREAKTAAAAEALKQGVDSKRLVELTKENALLEEQLITMTRKCQAVEDELKLRTYNYDAMEKEMGDMDAAYQDKIARMKQTQRRQTLLLKQLYEKLRVAVPIAEYEAAQRALETCKQRQGELFVRTKEWATRVSDLEIKLRERQDAIGDQKELQASKNDLEKEYSIIKSRLEALDPTYARENELFTAIVEALRRGSVTATGAFEYFDEDKDGYLSRGEFERALMQMGIYGSNGPNALTNKDVDALIKAIDLDGDGRIQYREFERKLQRSGLRSLSKQELLMQAIVKGLRATGRTPTSLFGLINKDGSGYASRQDFRDMLTSLNLPGASPEELDNFIEYFYADDSRGSRVSLSAFLAAYKRLEQQLSADAVPRGGAIPQKRRRRVPRNILERKQEIFRQIDFALNKTGQNIGDLFARVDTDGSKAIDADELLKMLTDMQVRCTADEAQQIFESIDDDQSGTLQLSELRHDYDKCLQRSLDELVDEENRLHRPGDEEDFEAMAGGFRANKGQGAGGGMSKGKEIELTSRCKILKDQRDAAYEELRAQKEMRRLGDEALVLAERRGDTLRTQNNRSKEALFEQQEQIEKLKAQLDLSVSKGDSERIQAENERLKTELSDAEGALRRAESMRAVVGEQVKSLKLLHERKKDENESLANTVRDLQSKDFNEQKWGKLYQVVMLSRWQESAVNKKYAAKQAETAKLEAEVLSLAQQLENCRDRLHAAEQEQLRSSQQVRELRNKLGDRSNLFLSVEEGQEFSKCITELAEERTKLEERYFRVRAEQVTALDLVDTQTSKAEAAEALLLQLRTGGPDSLSAKLMAMSSSLQEARLAAMKAERKVRELGERENYLGKLLKSREDEVTALSDKLALLEKEYAQAQEKWRLADNARMQEFYNPKFGQDPGATAKGGLTTAASAAMALTAMGPQPRLNESSAPMDRRKINAQNEEIQGLREELARARARLEQKELEDQAMGGNATGQSFDVQAHAKMNLEKYQDEEKDQMRQAANETIRTLHKMLIEKNSSLAQKESTIKALREDMAEDRKRAADRYAELQRQYTDEGKSTLAGLQRIVSNNKQEPERYQPDPALKEVGKQSQVALRGAQDQLRQLQSDLQEKQSELAEARAMVAGERARTREIQASSDKIVKSLEAEAQAWKAKAAATEKAREEKNQAIIKRFDAKLLEYHKDKLRLEDDLKQARMKAAPDTSQRDKAKLSHKPVKEAAKAGQPSSAKKDALKGTDEDYLAIIKKGPSSETLSELVSICEKKDTELRTLRNDAKKASQEAANLARRNEGALEEKAKKIIKLGEDVARWQNDLRAAREDLKAEVERKEEIQGDWNKLRAEMQGAARAGSGPSYAEMGEKIKQLEKENFVLESQTTTVVAYNPQTSTYEYIGQPLPLQTRPDETGRAARDRAGQPIAAALGTPEEIVASLRSWFRLGVNDRLSLKQVFESLDVDRFGELGAQDFTKALARLGVSLQPAEHAMLAQALDPTKAGYLGYRALVRELEGIPQSLFMHPGLVKLAGVAVDRDLTPAALTSLLSGSPAAGARMTLEAFQKGFAQAEAPDFRFSSQEVMAIFAYITGAKGRVEGLKLEIDALVRKAFLGVHAILIERIRAALEHAGKTVAQIFAENDPRNTGFLDRKQLSRAFGTLMKKKLEKNMEEILFTAVFKPANSKGNTSGKISQSLLKFYLETFAPGSPQAPRKAAAPQQIDSSQGRAKQEAPGQGGQSLGVSPEMVQTSKRAARKILLQCHSNIVELVGKLDHLEEGIVNKQELKRAIQDQKVKELDDEELNVLLKLCDKGLKGYVSSNKVIEQLYALSNESECDVILRRLSKTLAHQDVNLAKALSAYESQVGTVEIPAFKKCLQGLACALTEQEISKVANEVCVPMTTTINVKQFVKQVAEAGKTQPLPNYITQGPRGSNTAGKGGKGNPMAAFDAEKKYKKNLEALKNEIEEKNREAQGLRTEVKICHDRYKRLEQERQELERKLVDKHTKPPRETSNEALAFGQAQELKQLKEQLNYAQDENTKLNKTIDVQLKSEINRLSQEKDDLQEKISELKGQVGHLNTVINRIHGQSLDNVEKREELGLFRQLRIEELEKQLEESEAAKVETQDQLFAAQENVLDLRFEKETYDLQYARLQKRIQVLEQYKMSSSQLSAAIDNDAKKDLAEIHEIAGATAASRKSANDNVKMKFSKGKNSSELEMVVESLKRVVEKLKTENDHLKKENSKYAGQSGQASLEKSLRQKISNLETVVASHEMKEINLDEKQKTIKKLIDAHKNLQEDLHKEQDRYMLLEKKYKDVLVKFNISDQENARNEELIFGMQTGSNMNRFRGFLAEKEDKYR